MTAAGAIGANAAASPTDGEDALAISANNAMGVNGINVGGATDAFEVDCPVRGGEPALVAAGVNGGGEPFLSRQYTLAVNCQRIYMATETQ